MNKEINIITLRDIFDNIETEEKAFKFLNYIKKLQNKNIKYKETIDKIKEYIKEELSQGGSSELKDLVNGDYILEILEEIE